MHVKDSSGAESKSDCLSDGAEIDEKLTQTVSSIRRGGFGSASVAGKGWNMPHPEVGRQMQADQLDDTSDPTRHT
jgi:hypothetical protein